MLLTRNTRGDLCLISSSCKRIYSNYVSDINFEDKTLKPYGLLGNDETISFEEQVLEQGSDVILDLYQLELKDLNSYWPDIVEYLKTDTVNTKLNLRNKRIGREDCPVTIESVCDILRHNHSITHLDLALNFIGIDEIRTLANLIETNYTLKSIDLSVNNIGPDGINILANSLRRNFSIDELILINCKVGPQLTIQEKLIEIASVNEAIINLGSALLQRNVITEFKFDYHNCKLDNNAMISLSRAPLRTLHVECAINDIYLPYLRAPSRTLLLESETRSTNFLNTLLSNEHLEHVVLGNINTLVNNDLNLPVFSDNTVFQMANLLRTNVTLKSLRFRVNNVTNIGIQSLCEILNHNRIIERIEFCDEETPAIVDALSRNEIIRMQFRNMYNSLNNCAPDLPYDISRLMFNYMLSTMPN